MSDRAEPAFREFVSMERVRSWQRMTLSVKCNSTGCTEPPTHVVIWRKHGHEMLFSLACDTHSSRLSKVLDAIALPYHHGPPTVMCPPIGARP